ncbi:uncharacterized protein LOC107693384 isoform X1 [Sinocyclocheilus anshuiensis]|uniref:uncharacterized protein LOC107693384 isoform X1 n=1 Tax=Sinocyclocheilus anshuiensis TaxID=1608454 RepID=UPI0007BA5D1A|nr:PREDICTED: uncharacterized protein LOC107693384 isoform X1 [Sinocyclocheilus anshuiensis]
MHPSREFARVCSQWYDADQDGLLSADDLSGLMGALVGVPQYFITEMYTALTTRERPTEETGPGWSAHQLGTSGPLFTGRPVLQTPRDHQETLRPAADATAAAPALNTPPVDFTQFIRFNRTM